MIGELLASGVSVLPKNAPFVLPIAASHNPSLAARQMAELAARRDEVCASWRVGDTFVGLALDHEELTDAQRAVEARRSRLAALEQELRELGVGTDSSGSSSESGDGDEEDSDESDEETSSGSEDREIESEASEGSKDEGDG